jgi:ParB family transcriptional regulator, chromosome partitioning protein
MAKANLKSVLEKKLLENNRRHASADQETNFDSGRQHVMIHVENIVPNPFQPRRIFPQQELEKLALSISELGLLEPILVRKFEDHYQIAAGERRWRAHKLLGKGSIECLVSDITDSDMAILAIAENVDREDLSDYEIGTALKKIEALFPTRKKLAESIGLHREDLYRYFAFDDLPDFIRNDLDTNPRLMGRSAANDLKRLLKQISEEPFLESCLHEVWTQLVSGDLEQTKLSGHLSRRIRMLKDKHEIKQLKNSHSLMKLGRKVGSITWDDKHLVVKLKVDTMSSSQENQLKEFLENLLNS